MLLKISKKIFFTPSLNKFFNSTGIPQPDKLVPNLQQKLKKLQDAKPYFDRLISFDPDYLAQIPFIFQPLDPVVESAKNFMLSINSYVGLPWWSIIIAGCVFIRLTICPLIYVQMRRTTQLAPIAPVLVHIRKTYKQSNLSTRKKLQLSILAIYDIIKSQNLKMYRLFIYNMTHFPLIIIMIYSIRRLLAEEQLGKSTFLYISSLTAIDPYFIMPLLTVGLYYYNFQRFITKQNKNTFVSKIRGYCQLFLIVWLPFLCYWPSGIVLYMLTNAVFSVIQSTVLMNQRFIQHVNPKLLFYNYLLGIAEYDENKSQSVIESIKTGEDSFKEKQITEQRLVNQTQQMIQKLNKQLTKKQEEEDEQDLDENTKKIQQNKQKKIEGSNNNNNNLFPQSNNDKNKK